MSEKTEQCWTCAPDLKTRLFLEPCPFCGDHFEDGSCDRITIFKCHMCSYRRCFPGILQLNESVSKVPYSDGKGDIVPESEVKTQEYYHYDAKYKAVVEMNKRHLIDKQP